MKQTIAQLVEHATVTGVDSLKEEDLIYLCTGRRLQDTGASSIAYLDHAHLRDLGVTRQRTAQVSAAFEIARRAFKQTGQDAIDSPASALPHFAAFMQTAKEHFVALYLNARNQVLYKEVVSVGSLSASIAHPREIYRPAVLYSAHSLIVGHNHPSGDPSPSQDDISLTKRLIHSWREPRRRPVGSYHRRPRPRQLRLYERKRTHVMTTLPHHKGALFMKAIELLREGRVFIEKGWVRNHLAVDDNNKDIDPWDCGCLRVVRPWGPLRGAAASRVPAVYALLIWVTRKPRSCGARRRCFWRRPSTSRVLRTR